MPKAFERIVIVMLENTMRASALANPYLNSLRKKGVYLANSQGVTHPSQPNYLCMVAGDTMRIVDDENHYVLGFYGFPTKPGYSLPNVTDLLEAHHLSWKCYAENLTEAYKAQLPANLEKYMAYVKDQPYNSDLGFDDWPEETFPFTRRHIPFLSFPSIVANPERLARVVNADEFEKDVRSGDLPHYSFYVPNLVNDGHTQADGTFVDRRFYQDLGEDNPQIENIATFLKGWLGDDPVSKFPPETLIVLTFDEAYPYQYDYGVYTLLIADFLEAGTTHTEPVNHFNLLATIEENFGIGNLKRNDAIAKPYWFLR